MTARRECAWCRDWEDQHDENGCRMCGRYPWEKGPYRCDKFYESGDEAEAAFEARWRKAEGLRKKVR